MIATLAIPQNPSKILVSRYYKGLRISSALAAVLPPFSS
jgi:hypothetical protein